MKCSLIQNCIGLMQTNADSMTNSGSKLKIEELNKSIDDSLLIKPTKPLIPYFKKKKVKTQKQNSTINTIDRDSKSNVSIENFIARSKDYEQKRILELEIKRFETINQEMKQLQDRPTINIKFKRIPNKATKPLYTRVKEEVNKKKIALDNPEQIYHNNQQMEESTKSNIDNNNKSNKSKIQKPNKFKGKETTERIQAWINRQFENIDINTKKQQKEEIKALKLQQNEYSFRPEISAYSKEIANKRKRALRNRSNDENSCQVHNRLYSQRNNKSENKANRVIETLSSQMPHYNNNSKILHQKNIFNQSRGRKRPLLKKQHLIENKSKSLEKMQNSIKLDLHNTIITNTNVNNINIGNQLEPKDPNEEKEINHWSTLLWKMSQNNDSNNNQENQPIDSKLLSYKLNVRQNGAWNQFAENHVDYYRAKGILSLLLD